MKIETVQWKWADAVLRKEVYRDEEFVRSSSKEEALLAIDFLMRQPKGLTYTITVLREGEYFTYFRHQMPCYGGLVKYLASHGEKYNMNPYFPRDIRVAYPEGDTIFIACFRDGFKQEFEKPYYQFIFSEESPWVSAFGTKESIIVKDNYFVLTNMNTDPTVLYSLLRLGGVAYSSNGGSYNPKAEILAFKSSSADPRRLAGQKPIRTSGGTWAEGYGYTRPYNESIFKTALPTKYADFKDLPTTGYPPAFKFTNEYFVTTMKEVFEIDVASVATKLAIDSGIETALVKSWEYFKEMSKQLDE